MKHTPRAIAITLMLILMSGLTNAQTLKPKASGAAAASATATPQNNVQAAGAATAVTGSGTPGQLTNQ